MFCKTVFHTPVENLCFLRLEHGEPADRVRKLNIANRVVLWYNQSKLCHVNGVIGTLVRRLCLPQAYFSFRGLHLSAPLIPREGGVFVSLLSVICEIIQTGVAVSALLLEVSERIGKKKGKDDREK